MKLSILLVIISVVASALAKQTEPEVQPALTFGVTTSSSLISSGTVDADESVLVLGWSATFPPSIRVDGFIVENMEGLIVTNILSGLGETTLSLAFRNIPGTRSFFQYRFFGGYVTGTSDTVSLENVKPHEVLLTNE